MNSKLYQSALLVILSILGAVIVISLAWLGVERWFWNWLFGVMR